MSEEPATTSETPAAQVTESQKDEKTDDAPAEPAEVAVEAVSFF